MVTGLKPTSGTIVISAQSTEAAAGVLQGQQVNLQLNALDNEVFVVTMINLDPDAPDAVQPLSSAVDCSISTQERTTVGNISNSNVLAAARMEIICAAATTADGGISFSREDPLTSDPNSDYIGIIATSDLFVNVIGTNNGNAKACRARIYGFRSRASSSVYAALVQSELLS
jgi:hypothetical protein